MDSDTAHMMDASKVPMLIPGEFEIWRMRIEQCIQMMDYALWDVIENGLTLLKTQVVEGVTTFMSVTSVEDKAQRRLEVKARSTLMMGITNEHQLMFNSIKDAKQLLEAIEKRFEVKGMSSSSTNTQNMAFVSSSNNNITNGANNTTQAVNTTIGVSTAGTQVNTANIDNLNDAVICAFLASQPKCYNCHKRGHFARECRAPRSQDTTHKESTRRTVLVETPALTTLVSCDGLGGYDWSDQAEEDNCKKGLGYENYNAVSPPYTRNFMPLKPDLSYIGLDEFADKPVVENKSSEELTKAVRKNLDAPIVEDWVSDDEEENVRNKQERDKIGTKPDQIKKKQEVWRSPEKSRVVSVDRARKTQASLGKRPGIASCCTDYEEIDGGYVAFGGNPKGGKITGKGKFDGKVDEGLFVGYLMNSKAFRVFNSRKRIVEENLHIRFSKNTPNVVGSGPDWLFDIDALTKTINYEPIAAGTQSNDFAVKVNEDTSKGSECIDQEQDDNVNSTNMVNAASINKVNAVSENISNELLFDPNMPALEDISTFNSSSDIEDDDEEADINNMDITIQVYHVPTIKIHKDHPLD
nr:hypothetical protein [Tanacetum cinerariifolium]